MNRYTAKQVSRHGNGYIGMRTCLFVMLSCFSVTAANAIPTLVSAHDDVFDKTIPHYEYEEELERGKIEQEIEFEIDEANDIEEHIIEQELEVHNSTGADDNPRTNFFSNDDHNNLIDIFALAGGDSFSYFHQLPPSINPDVDPDGTSDQIFFNDFDFTTNLIEIEFELEGWTADDPMLSEYEVRITDGSVDIAILGSIEFGDLTSDNLYEFEFEFEQYDSPDDSTTFISSEIYTALADGIFDINIVRTSGSGSLYLEESELELEQAVPEPVTLYLLGSGLFGMIIFRRRPFRR